MHLTRTSARRPTRNPRVTAQGELIDAPSLRYLWALLAVVTALEAAEELGWIGGPAWVYQTWMHDGVLATSAVLVLARARYEPIARRAWLAFGAGLGLWAIGNIAWSLAYGARAHPPYPTFADGFWLLWYPLTALGMVFLIRVRLQRFELHRWLDGIAVTLIVLVAGFAFIVQPTSDTSAQSTLATVIDFSYPVLDVLLIGALLGVYGLLGWKPHAMWLLIGLSVLATTIGDATFAVQEARGVAAGSDYDWVWTVGALAMAAAAWVRAPGWHDTDREVTGMRAVALALIAQALAIGINVYATFEEVARSERVVTIIVLLVASVQIILTRPRPAQAPSDRPEADTPDRTASHGGSAGAP
jgi:hypothetical protein